MHASDLRQPMTLALAFPAGGTDATGDEDVGFQGFMQEAPRAGLIRRQGGEVGEIGAARFANTASSAARERIEADRAEKLAADAARSSPRSPRPRCQGRRGHQSPSSG
jgi:hypothetical protein